MKYDRFLKRSKLKLTIEIIIVVDKWIIEDHLGEGEDRVQTLRSMGFGLISLV